MQRGLLGFFFVAFNNMSIDVFAHYLVILGFFFSSSIVTKKSLSNPTYLVSYFNDSDTFFAHQNILIDETSIDDRNRK